MAAEFTLEQMMRTGHVKRWQIVRVAREQTVAEHCYRVWAIATHLCQVMNVPKGLSITAGMWALIHDVPEVITGDIATPAKAAMRAAVPNHDPVRNIELSLSDSYRKIWHEAKILKWCDDEMGYWPSAYDIVKLADLMEAKMFLGCEKMGTHAEDVYVGMCTAVIRKAEEMEAAHPGLDWPSIWVVVNKSWEKV